MPFVKQCNDSQARAILESLIANAEYAGAERDAGKGSFVLERHGIDARDRQAIDRVGDAHYAFGAVISVNRNGAVAGEAEELRSRSQGQQRYTKNTDNSHKPQSSHFIREPTIKLLLAQAKLNQLRPPHPLDFRWSNHYGERSFAASIG
jgi:hypothetical protein